MKKYNATAYDRKQAKELQKSGAKYIARNKDGSLHAFDSVPVRGVDGKWRTLPYLVAKLSEHGFKFVKWEDEEPTLIADIVHGGRI